MQPHLLVLSLLVVMWCAPVDLQATAAETTTCLRSQLHLQDSGTGMATDRMPGRPTVRFPITGITATNVSRVPCLLSRISDVGLYRNAIRVNIPTVHDGTGTDPRLQLPLLLTAGAHAATTVAWHGPYCAKLNKRDRYSFSLELRDGPAMIPAPELVPPSCANRDTPRLQVAYWVGSA